MPNISYFENIIEIFDDYKEKSSSKPVYYVNDLSIPVFYTIMDNWRNCPYSIGRKITLDDIKKLGKYFEKLIITLEIEEHLIDDYLFERIFHLSFIGEILLLCDQVKKLGELNLAKFLYVPKVEIIKKVDPKEFLKVIEVISSLCLLPNVFSRDYFLYNLLDDYFTTFNRDFDKWEKYTTEFVIFISQCILPACEAIFVNAFLKYVEYTQMDFKFKNEDYYKELNIKSKDILKDYIKSEIIDSTFDLKFNKLNSTNINGANYLIKSFRLISNNIYNKLIPNTNTSIDKVERVVSGFNSLILKSTR